MTNTLTPRVRMDNAKELAFELIVNGNLSVADTATVIEHLAQVAIYTGSEAYETADWWYAHLEVMRLALIN